MCASAWDVIKYLFFREDSTLIYLYTIVYTYACVSILNYNNSVPSKKRSGTYFYVFENLTNLILTVINKIVYLSTILTNIYMLSKTANRKLNEFQQTEIIFMYLNVSENHEYKIVFNSFI